MTNSSNNSPDDSFITSVDIQNDCVEMLITTFMKPRVFPRGEDGPPSGAFVPVVWRGTTSNPIRPEDAIGISFDCEDGSTIRLLMTHEGAKHAAETLLERVHAYQFFRYDTVIRRHSLSESGNPSVDVSTPEECG